MRSKNSILKFPKIRRIQAQAQLFGILIQMTFFPRVQRIVKWTQAEPVSASSRWWKFFDNFFGLSGRCRLLRKIHSITSEFDSSSQHRLLRKHQHFIASNIGCVEHNNWAWKKKRDENDTTVKPRFFNWLKHQQWKTQ